jgi:tetratricopeptide (TPR) repeat protein
MRAVAGLAALLMVASASAGNQDAIERAMRQALAESHKGMSALDKGNATKAREAFERALKSVPDFPDAVIGLGHVAMKERRFGDALELFRSAEAGYKSMSSATVQFEADRYARSRDELQELRTQLAQLDVEAMQSQSRFAANNPSGPTDGQIERMRNQARARIQQLESMEPPNSSAVREAPAEVFFFQGNALFNLKRTPEAIAVWEESLRRNPKQPLVQNNLAVAYWMTGRLDDATRAVQRAETLGFKVNPSFRADLDKAVAAKH